MFCTYLLADQLLNSVSLIYTRLVKDTDLPSKMAQKCVLREESVK